MIEILHMNGTVEKCAVGDGLAQHCELWAILEKVRGGGLVKIDLAHSLTFALRSRTLLLNARHSMVLPVSVIPGARNKEFDGTIKYVLHAIGI